MTSRDLTAMVHGASRNDARSPSDLTPAQSVWLAKLNLVESARTSAAPALIELARSPIMMIGALVATVLLLRVPTARTAARLAVIWSFRHALAAAARVIVRHAVTK